VALSTEAETDSLLPVNAFDDSVAHCSESSFFKTKCGLDSNVFRLESVGAIWPLGRSCDAGDTDSNIQELPLYCAMLNKFRLNSENGNARRGERTLPQNSSKEGPAFQNLDEISRYQMPNLDLSLIQNIFTWVSDVVRSLWGDPT
jgi:hypothetical protein